MVERKTRNDSIADQGQHTPNDEESVGLSIERMEESCPLPYSTPLLGYLRVLLL